MKKLKYCLLLVILPFVRLLNVNAETQNLSVSFTKGYVYGNGALVWNSENNTNTSARFDYNNGLGMGISLRLFGLREDGTNVGKYIKINYTTCISGGTPFATGFNGYSSPSNVTGDFTYYKDGKLGKQGSCTVGGQTGVLSTNYIIFTIKSENVVDQNTAVSEGTLTMWNGETANTAGYATFNAISVTEYNPTDNSNTIIDQNDTIIDKQDETNSKLDEAENTRKGIWETIKGIPGKILDGFKSLFIPEDMGFLDDFKETLENKLGFIAQIPIAIIDFGLDLVNLEVEEMTSITFPTIEIMGVHFWPEMNVDITPILDKFKNFKYLTDVLCVTLCVNTLRKWRERFTGGGEVN